MREGRESGAGLLTWFSREESFLKRLAHFETECQVLGFAVLGIEFWGTTRSAVVALAIGAVYPAVVYFGMTRKRNAATMKRLREEEQQVTEFVSGEG